MVERAPGASTQREEHTGPRRRLLPGLPGSIGLPGLIVALLLPGSAIAGRVAVLDFGGGAGGKRARAGLVQALMQEEGIELVSRSTFTRAAREAGVAPGELTSASGLRRASAVAAVDLVLTGRLAGRGGKARIWIDLYDADGQRRLHRAYRPSRGGALRDTDRNRIVTLLLDLAPAPQASPGAGDLEPDPFREGDRGARAGEGSRTEGPRSFEPSDRAPRHDREGPREDLHATRDRRGGVGQETPRVRGRGTREGFAPSPGRRAAQDPDAWAQDDPDPYRPSDGSTNRPPFVLVRARGQIATRDYLLQGTYTTVAYKTQGVFPEVGLDLEIAPGAGSGPWLSDLALEASGSYGFLASQFEDATGTLQRNATPVIRLTADLRYRVPLAAGSLYSPRLGLRAGLYQTRFSVPAADLLFRTVTHRGLRVGVDVVQPLLPPFLSLRVWGTFLPLSKPGAPEAEAYGPSASSSGYWAEVGFIGSSEPSGRGLTWLFSVQVIQHADRFAGTGQEDANASASEEQVVISAGLGYAY